MILIKEEIKKMADLLRSGHTMLNLACPICNNPIFKNKAEELFCPVCNREVIMVNNDKQTVALPIEQRINKESLKPINGLKSDVIEIITEKIDFLIQKLKKETQIDLIEKYLNLISKCYDIIEKEKS